jgi:hypothetical protein
MSDTDHPAGTNGNGTPTWWPPADTPPTNVVVMPDRPTPADPGPPAPPPPPPAPPPPLGPPPYPPAAVPPLADVVGSDAVPGRATTDRIKSVRVSAQRHRRWIALAGGVIITLAGLNWYATNTAKSIGKGISEPLEAHNAELDNMVAGIAQARSAPSQVSVQQPLAWLNCPVGTDAGTMIGYDPNTQYATLDPQRASAVESQVRAFVVQNPLESLRLTATDATTLTVMVGGTKGVPLVDCSGATKAARQDPSKTGGDSAPATTAATR